MDIYYNKQYYRTTTSTATSNSTTTRDNDHDDDIESGNENDGICRRLLSSDDYDNNNEEPSSRRSSSSGGGDNNALKPVIVFYTGGAWIIGYKMWGTLLGRILNSDACGNFVVVIPDVRNYPWATVPDMIDDCNSSLQYIFQNIQNYGGDPNTIILVGQSAGGHIACTTLLQKAMKLRNLQQQQQQQQHTTSQEEDELITLDEHINNAIAHDENDNGNRNGHDDSLSSLSSSWQPTDLKGFISLSAPYSLNAMKQTFLKHGLDESLVVRIFGVVTGTSNEVSNGDNFDEDDDGEDTINRNFYDLEQNDDNETSTSRNTGNPDGTSLLDQYDPYAIVRNYNANSSKQCRAATANSHTHNDNGNSNNSLSNYLPPIKLFHGTKDKTVPYDGSFMFYQELVAATSTSSSTRDIVTFKSYDGWSHTDPILEGPMDADHRFHRDIFESVKEWTSATTTTTAITTTTTEGTTTTTPHDDQTLLGEGEWPENDPIITRRLCPHVLIQAGRFCNPF